TRPSAVLSSGAGTGFAEGPADPRDPAGYACVNDGGRVERRLELDPNGTRARGGWGGGGGARARRAGAGPGPPGGGRRPAGARGGGGGGRGAPAGGQQHGGAEGDAGPHRGAQQADVAEDVNAPGADAQDDRADGPEDGGAGDPHDHLAEPLVSPVPQDQVAD